jgi:hypothetical protein
VVTYRPREDEAPPRAGMVAETGGAPAVTSPEPLPSDVSPHRLRGGLLRLGGVVAIAVVT